MATSKSHNSGTVKDTCKMFAPNWEFSGSGNQIVIMSEGKRMFNVYIKFMV